MGERVRPPRRALVIQFHRLGDVILSAGLLEDLRRAFPAAQLDFLVGARAAPLLDGHPLIAERIVYDREHPLRMARAVRARRYDWVIDVQGNPRTAMLTRFSGAPVRAGWAIGPWQWVYTHTLSRTGRPTEYVLRERQRLLEMLGIRVGAPRTRLAVTADERARAERELRAAGAPPDPPRVALVLSVTEPVREWPVERFAELAEALARQGLAPVALLNPGDEAKVARLRALAPSVAVVPTPDLRLLLGAIAASRVLVSGDSGPAHMATALGVPRVTIYGPTNPAAWNPGLPTTPIVRDETMPVMRTKDWGSAADSPGLTGVASAAVLARVRELLAEPPPSAVPDDAVGPAGVGLEHDTRVRT
jgi:ADP-heptose:LPS heptosyltransferase